MEGVGVDRHHRVAGLEQPVDEQPIGPLDRDRQPGRLSDVRQPVKCTLDPALVVHEAEALNHRGLLVDDAERMRSLRPIDSDKHPVTSPIDDTCLGAEGPSRVLIRRPSTRLTPHAGRGPSARPGRQDSRWLSESKRTRPSPSERQEQHRTLTSGSDGIIVKE